MFSPKFRPKSALAAAAIFSLATIGSAVALPAANLANTAKTSVGVQQVQWGWRGPGWRRGRRWRRPLYGFAGPRWRRPGWGWRGRRW
jgi:hypothetical protein